MAVLIDSDVLVEVSRGRNEEVLSQWDRLSGSDLPLMCSPVTIAEIWHGAREKEHGILERLFSLLMCIPIDDGIGRKAGEYLQRYRKSHALALALGDCLIAATACTTGAELWTRNRKHYPMNDVRFYL